MSALAEPVVSTPWWEKRPYKGSTDGPYVKIVTLTPQMAQELLAVNRANRPVREPHRAMLAGAIERGEFVLTNDAVVIDSDGHLSNGQHRCHAVVDTGISVQVTVMFQAPPTLKDQIDQSAARRTFGHVLSMHGEKNANALAAVTRNVFWWEQDGVPVSQNRQVAPTVSQLLAVLERRPDLRDAIGQTPREEGSLVTQSFAATHFYIFSLVDADSAEVFFEKLASGAGLVKGDPILTLRDRLIREALRASGSLALITKSAFFHRAWHAWMEGQQLMKLDWRRGGAKPDRFPSITVEE